MVRRLLQRGCRRRGDREQISLWLRGGGLRLEKRQVFAGCSHHCRWDAGELRDLQAVALGGRAFVDRVQEDDAVLVFDGVEVDVGDLGNSSASRVSSK